MPGAFFSAIGLVVLQSIFGFYVALSDPTPNNQLLASIVLLLTWMYFCRFVVLVGAVINAVLSNRSEDVNTAPVLGGLPKEPATDLEREQRDVSRETLDRLQHALDGAGHLRLVTEGDSEDFGLPYPDSVTVDSDTSALPGIHDTASIALQWAETDQG